MKTIKELRAEQKALRIALEQIDADLWAAIVSDGMSNAEIMDLVVDRDQSHIDCLKRSADFPKSSLPAGVWAADAKKHSMFARALEARLTDKLSG